MKNLFQKVITYGLYPFLLISQLTIFTFAIFYEWDLKTIFLYMGPTQFSLLLGIEFIFPIKREWKMTWKSFFRDIKYMIAGGLTSRGIRFLIGYAAIYLSEKNVGVLKQFPFVLSVICVLVTWEFMQYWFHRLSHEAGGKIGNFLWRVHSAHHLPDKVYLLMHPVFHPLNSLVTTVMLQGILIFAGVDAKTIYLLNIFMGLQGLISHFNVDIRAGFFNYIFIGTELHRFHHSANINESKNYGGILSIWDIVFGTFYYKPGTSPARLGVAQPEEYPESTQILKVLLFPFKSAKDKSIQGVTAEQSS